MEIKSKKQFIKMKIIKILIVLFIANIGPVQAQYTAIPDFCFEYILIQNGIDTLGNYDGQILTSDIENITILDAVHYDCNIYDLTGIEDFTALEELYCFNNHLTNLNISQNLQLRELSCENNDLTSLDISNNHLLKRIICYNNYISTFISSANNVNLEKLQISSNNLSSISLTYLSNLKYFGCINNVLNNLDFTSNLNIERIACINNQTLTSIDLRNGNNTIITQFNTLGSPNLTCIYVDDAQYSQTNWLTIDSNSNFVETEDECEALVIEDTNIENDFLIYPNPIKDILNIGTNSNNKLKKVIIYDLLGKIILQTNRSTIDLSNTKKGIYFVRIMTKKGNIFNKKIIKIGA